MSTKNHLATAKPTQRQKHISAADLKQIAFLVECRRMNYKEACAFLDIPYPTWRNFIQRSGSAPKWDDMVARVKAAYLEGRLANIQDAETGKNGHRPDWRASKALLEFAAPERYLPQLPPQDAGRQPAVATTTISVMVQSVYGPNAKPSAIVDAQEVRQIEDQPAEPEPAEPMKRTGALPGWWKAATPPPSPSPAKAATHPLPE